ncbi:MAG: hypothetical protein V4558_02325 [Gemmatimonadota bacterium]
MSRAPGLDNSTGAFPLVSVRGALVALPIQATPLPKRSLLRLIRRWLSRIVSLGSPPASHIVKPAPQIPSGPVGYR